MRTSDRQGCARLKTSTAELKRGLGKIPRARVWYCIEYYGMVSNTTAAAK